MKGAGFVVCRAASARMSVLSALPEFGSLSSAK
jgi:hypothetical protein